jgi:hypothetical protein
MRSDPGTRTAGNVVVTQIIFCVTPVKGNAISLFVAIDLKTEFSRYIFSSSFFHFQHIRLLILQLHLLLFCPALVD